MFGRLVFTILAMSLGLTACAETRGRNSGIITVSNVGELVHAIQTAINSDTIVVSTNGSPYKFEEVQSMSRVGHLYIDKTITIRGQSGRPEDVVFIANGNRIMYVNAPGCMIGGITFQDGTCQNNTITNQAPKETGYGGAIYLAQTDNECLVMNCRFEGNGALRGGAIASAKIGESSSIVDNCVFAGNNASVYGGASYGISSLNNCMFYENSSENSGGAVAYASNVVGSAFVMNSSTKGGALAFSVLNGCALTNNVGDSGSELFNCTATNIEIKSEGTSSRLYNVTMNRGRITVTNGVLFTGTCNVRNTLVADGAYFSFCKSMRMDGNDVSPQFINCTIVNNKEYRLRHNTKTESDVYFRNCLFFGNTYQVDSTGIRINWEYITNNTYKTIAMSKGERNACLGWDGTFPPSGDKYSYEAYSNESEVYYNLLDEPYTKVTIQMSGGQQIEFEPTYRQFYYAFGWDGLSMSIDPMSMRTYEIKPKTASYILDLMSSYTTNMTWESYYVSKGWDGHSDYIGGGDPTGNYDVDMYSLEMSRFYSCIFNLNYVPSEDAIFPVFNCYLYTAGFDPKFAGVEKMPRDPYAIDKSSSACHSNFSKNGMSQITIEPWMLTDVDLLGNPRLYGGGLDVGCYQALSLISRATVIKFR